jgi:hypothetical protein
MNVNLGDAVAGVGLAISVINDYIAELARIDKLPRVFEFQREILGINFDLTILLETPPFEMVQPQGGDPYTRMVLTGTIEARLAGQPESTPITFPLDAKVKIGLVLILPDPAPSDPVPVIGLEYQGADGTPAFPVTEDDLDVLFASEDIRPILEGTRLDLARPLVEGLNSSLFPEEPRPRASEWTVTLHLMPGADETDDSFVCLVGPPGTTAIPVLRVSFVPALTGLAIAYNRDFLDLMLQVGGDNKEGKTLNDAEIVRLDMEMGDDVISVSGNAVRRVFILPDVDITFKGPMVPALVRGTTSMSFDVSDIKVDVADEDERFFNVLKYFVTFLAGALLFTGWAPTTIAGIVLWLTAVQKVWDADADIENAPNTVRDSLASSLGAELSELAKALDDDNEVGELRIDATPDSLVVAQGNMVFLAQILVKPINARLRRAEYSKRLRRFVIFELEDGRRFRAQELARLISAGKVTVPGFHQVDKNYLRANPDDAESNNLLRQFKQNLTTEVVVPNVRS